MPDHAALLRASHDRLRSHLEPMSSEELSAQSYDDDWSIADVASHLGSGAEIFEAYLAAGIDGKEPPSDFVPVWERWNAMSPALQASSSVVANEAFLRRLEGLTPEQRDGFVVPMFGMQAELPMLLGMRLGEHVLHSWDILVMADPAAELPPDQAAAMIETVERMLGRAMKTVEGGGTVAVTTSGPERRFVLNLDTAGQVADDAVADAEVTMPAAAFLRLASGRLDAEHTPDSVQGDAAVLDRLRQAFPGF